MALKHATTRARTSLEGARLVSCHDYAPKSSGLHNNVKILSGTRRPSSGARGCWCFRVPKSLLLVGSGSQANGRSSTTHRRVMLAKGPK